MRTHVTIALSMIIGFVLGVATIEGLRAQALPPVYVIAEIDVFDADGYIKEYGPTARALVKKYGGKLIAASSQINTLEGREPQRVAIQQWEDMEQVQKWFDSAEYKANRRVGDKYARFRLYALEGMSPR